MRTVSMILLGGWLLLSGCESKEAPPQLPELIAVTGVIKAGGKPLENATVIFMPIAKGGFSAMGVTDGQGKYGLQTRAGQDVHPGIPAGEYQVMVSRMVKPDGSVLPRDPSKPPAMSAARQSISPEFSMGGAMNKQKANVTKTSNSFDFEVSMMRGAGPPGGPPKP